MANQDVQLEFSAFLDKEVIPKVKRLAVRTGQAAVEVVLLSCMDFRYPHRIVETMDARGLRGKYDHLILAGASLGVLHATQWQKTFIDHLRFAVDKHGASQVVILDHRDCGAYKEFLGVTPADPAQEKAAHEKHARMAMDLIVKEIPSLKGNVYALLLPIEHIDDLGRA
jgi:carbonic anhydrase